MRIPKKIHFLYVIPNERFNNDGRFFIKISQFLILIIILDCFFIQIN